MNFNYSEKTENYLKKLKAFMKEHVYPFEKEWMQFNVKNNYTLDYTKWTEHPKLNELKALAKEQGLWNLFLPDEKLGQGLSVLEYAPLAEEMGRVYNAAEIFNCNAPDTGNMEVLYHFGNQQQKDKYLTPLLEGKIKSVFCMTEPDVASSDATNIETSIIEDGDEVVINGKKWWSTGLGHPDAKIAIVMGKTDPNADKHEQHTMVLVNLNAKGVEIKRMLPTIGAYDSPIGHGEVHFNNVRVPKENIILGLGKGFFIAQGRLGPGRIHHCMRCIGASERVLEMAIKRSLKRTAFGKPLGFLGGNSERFAEARIEINQARLLTQQTAWKIDNKGLLDSLTDISAIKVIAPRMLQKITDMAIQIHGGGGLSDDFPFSAFYLQARSLRLADGPDEVHLRMISRLEFGKYKR